MAVRRLCVEPGCGSWAVYRGRCAAHRRDRARTRYAQAANQRLYRTKRWQVLRRHKLDLAPICEEPGCERLATDVHHRQPVNTGGDPWAVANLEALCHEHHSRRTRMEQLGMEGKGRVGTAVAA